MKKKENEEKDASKLNIETFEKWKTKESKNVHQNNSKKSIDR